MKAGIIGVVVLAGVSLAAWQAGGMVGSGSDTDTPGFTVNRSANSVYESLIAMPLPGKMHELEVLEGRLPEFDLRRDKVPGKSMGWRILLKGTTYLAVRADLRPKGEQETEVAVAVDLPDSAFSQSDELKIGDITLLGNLIDAYATAWLRARLNGRPFDERSFLRGYERHLTKFDKEFYRGFGRRVEDAIEDVTDEFKNEIERRESARQNLYRPYGEDPTSSAAEFQYKSQQSANDASKPMTNLPGN